MASVIEGSTMQSVCPACGIAIRLPDDAGGKPVRCRACSHVWVMGSRDHSAALPAWWQSRWSMLSLLAVMAVGWVAVIVLMATRPSGGDLSTTIGAPPAGDAAPTSRPQGSEEITSARAALRDRDAALSEVKTQLAEARATVASLQTDLRERNAHLVASGDLLLVAKKAIERLQTEKDSLAITLLDNEDFLRTAIASRPLCRDAGTLGGLAGCQILVEDVHSSCPLSQSRIREIVEFQFRKARVPILPEADAILYVQVTSMKVGEVSTAYAIECDVRCMALAKPTLNKVAAAVWESPTTIGYAGSAVIEDAMRRSIEEKVDQYLNDYLAANPAR